MSELTIDHPQIHSSKNNSFLANNLLRVVLSVYFIVAVSITGLQLKIEYDITKKNLEYEIIFNGKSIVQPLSLALWNFDYKQVDSLLDVIQENKNISHVEIVDLSRPNTEPTKSDYKKVLSQKVKGVSIYEIFNEGRHSQSVYQFDVFHDETKNSIGTLYLYSNTSVLLSKIKPLFLITIFNALIKILVIALVFYIVFYQMVGKRLKVLKDAITDFNHTEHSYDSHNNTSFKKMLASKNDELGDIFSSFQILQRDIIVKNKEINNQKKSLELAVLQRTEELENALAALEKSNNFKSQFLANMSHEIRTPMNGIIGVAELIKDTELSDEQYNHISTILNSGHALTTIINDILDFSKIEAGKMHLENIEFNLRDLVDETLQLFRKQILDSPIFLGTDISSNVPDIICGDPTRVRQILLNLIGNAFKFTKEGEIYVMISLIEINNDLITLKYEITDTGIGIEQNRQDELFSAFTQADTSISRNYGGTGLGLAISKRLCALMNGEIGFNSELQQGSTFWFTGIFKTHEKLNSEHSISHKISELIDKRLLIIEPNNRLNDVLQVAASDWGLIVDCVSNTSLANKVINQNKHSIPYDFVVINNEQPEIEGIKFCEQQFSQHKKPDVILLNKTAIDIEINTLRKFGIYRIMTHPITANKLKSILIGRYKSNLTTPPKELVNKHKFSLLKVLVAEDNEVNQVVIKGFLKKLNITPTLCATGLEAVDKVQEQEFNFIFMDCEMPEMDGYEATKLIKTKHPNMIIIGLSAHALQEHRLKALKSGMDDYITKPIKRNEIIEKLEHFQKVIINQNKS
ncbi:response regulator [Marinicellulosiphila megalodicopiae]|uniref:response regulator n=1 Tax=Marinicellulosiphila megalodicopiae TaxID=2724896 RepID=UPI003BAE3D79